MVSGNASRDAKFSVLSLLSISAILAGGLIVGVDKWITPGLHTVLKMGSCQEVGARCLAALFSLNYILGNPKTLLIILGLLSIAFALVKAFLVLFFPHLTISHFAEPEVLPAKLERILRKLNLPKTPPIRISSHSQPLAFTAGVLRSSICLSQGVIDTLSEKELGAVFSHEYAHIKRKDNFFIFLMLLLRDMLYLLPLSHFFFKMFVRDKEHAADDMAVILTRDPLSLASAIILLSRARAQMDPSPVYSTFFPDRATAQSRIRRLVEKSAVQPKRESRRLLVSFFLSLLILGTLAGAALAVPVSQPTAGCGTNQAHLTKNVCCTR